MERISGIVRKFDVDDIGYWRRDMIVKGGE